MTLNHSATGSKPSNPLRRRGAVASGFRRALAAAPRWLLAGTLIAVPWIMGGTVPAAVRVLILAAAAAGLLTAAGWMARWQAVRLDWLNVACAGLLLAQGWLMTADPRYVHDPAAWRFVPVRQGWESGVGSVDQATSAAAMGRITALLVWLLLAGDFARDPRGRERLRWSVVLAAAGVALFGLVQRSLQAPSIFWQGAPTTSPFFATFYYAPNAGAFLNLAFPLALGLAMAARREGEREARWQRPLSLLAACLCLAAAGVNASRAALVILLLSTLALAGWHALHRKRHAPPARRRRRGDALAGGAGVLALAVIVASVGTEMARRKWLLLPGQLGADNLRLLAMSAEVRMIPDAGAWGFGPGTFAIVFPHYTHFLGDRIAGIWRYAHDDYLQTLLEWGWVGATAWGCLFFGGLHRCFATALDPRTREREQTLAFAAGVALAGVALHALVDFPLQIASLQLDVVTLLGVAAAGPRYPVSAGR